MTDALRDAADILVEYIFADILHPSQHEFKCQFKPRELLRINRLVGTSLGVSIQDVSIKFSPVTYCHTSIKIFKMNDYVLESWDDMSNSQYSTETMFDSLLR